MTVEDITIRIQTTGEDELDKALKTASMSFKQFNKHLDRNFLSMQKSGKVTDRLTGQTTSYGQQVQKATIVNRRFKFEWLSIMFAGMALDRVFGNLIRKQFELWGVSEGLAGMWNIVMAPAMGKVTPALWDMIGAISNLPFPIQEAIGYFVLFMGGLAKILSIGGQLMLLFGGLKIMFPAAFAKMSLAVGAFLSAAWLPLLIAIAVLAVLAIAIYLAWKSNFMKIRDNIAKFVAAFKQWFGGIIMVVKGALNIIKGIFTGDFKLVRKGIVQVFKGLWNWFIGGWKMLGQGIIIIFKGVAKLLYNIFKVVIDGILWAADKAMRFFGGKGVSFRMPSFQTGGLVTRTGPAFLHKGERVVPKGRDTGAGVTFSPTVNLSATINNEMDVRVLADKLNKYWAADFERIVQSRGVA